MDVQIIKSFADASLYMTKVTRYISKESVLFKQLLQGQATWQSLKTLYKWQRPSEAELYLHLLKISLFYHSAKMKCVVPPTLRSARTHALYQAYLTSSTKDPSECFADWLRRHRTDNIEVPMPYQQAKVRALAIDFCSFWKPDFFSQWLCMFGHAATHVCELLHDDGSHVPEHLSSFVHAWRRHPDVCDNDAAVRREFTLLGVAAGVLPNLVAYVHALRTSARLYLQGAMYSLANPLSQTPRVPMVDEQRAVVGRVLSAYKLVHDSDSDELVSSRKAFAITGAAGTGKSVVLCHLADALL